MATECELRSVQRNQVFCQSVWLASLGLSSEKAQCSLALLLNCLSNLEVHTCLHYSQWLLGPQELRMWRKKAFVQLSFGILSIQWWITFFNKSRTWLCQDWQREWEETIGFVLNPHAELTASWGASSLQHKMKCGQMHMNARLPWAFQDGTIGVDSTCGFSYLLNSFVFSGRVTILSVQCSSKAWAPWQSGIIVWASPPVQTT